ncbi:MAG TPA: DUF2339 domain-containing protein, partial [Flavisolibacter sp.]|nr:DUF2339 domain-containing protein [Flavisolibacter sp.]
MKEDERINLLQQELEDLQRRLAQQQHEVERMKRQLGNLAGQKQEVHGVAPGDASSWSLENFIGLRLIHFIGIIVLVVGLSIGVKYAIDRNLISEGLRIGLAYGAGAILYGLSLRLRNKYVLFSAILFSGGMASVYFTTYAAHVYYSIFSFAFAFILMVLLTVYTVYEAMRYSRQEIALLGLVGAYGIPFLISANSDRPELFFIYISLINLGVAFLFIKRSWRQVNWAAQLLTWVLFIGWASMGQTAGTKEQGIFF